MTRFGNLKLAMSLRRVFFSSSRLLLGKTRQQNDESVDEKVNRRSKKVSSLCIQLPGVADQRPPSIHSSVTDDGGFLEPSPEIKALSNTYDFENDMPPVPPIPSSHPDVISGVTYVDLAHRAQPEGIESDDVYHEDESYRRLENGSAAIVYATIKPELPLKDLVFEKENIPDIDAVEVTKVQQVEQVEREYVSPQRLLDPTRTRLHDQDEVDFVLSKTLPPVPVDDRSETETEEDDEYKPMKKVPPPVPELNSPLDLQDVKFADASDNDDSYVSRRKTSSASEQAIPDAMTADEADRLLSSRYGLRVQSTFYVQLNLLFLFHSQIHSSFHTEKPFNRITKNILSPDSTRNHSIRDTIHHHPSLVLFRIMLECLFSVDVHFERVEFWKAK